MKEKDFTILEIYKMFADSTQHISDCRQHSNQFYILLNSGVIAYNSLFPSFLIITLGILINIVWFLKIQSYKRLNKAKFKVIEKIEKRLPIQVYNHEYLVLKQLGHKALSYYESLIPCIFIIIFIFALGHKYFEQIIKVCQCIFK